MPEYQPNLQQQCGQIQKIGQKADLIEKIIHPPKCKTTSTQQFCCFQTTYQVTKVYFLRKYMQKRQKNLALLSFLSECSQGLTIQNQDDSKSHHLQKWFTL